MKTKTINIYSFDELPDSGKEEAREWYRYHYAYAWQSESVDSIKAFCDEFGVTLKNYSVEPFGGYWHETDANNTHFRGLRLKDFDREAMPTGYCLDSDMRYTFHEVFKRTGDAKQAFDAALDSGFAAWRADMEHQNSNEYIDECIMMNEYEFTKDGAIA